MNAVAPVPADAGWLTTSAFSVDSGRTERARARREVENLVHFGGIGIGRRIESGRFRFPAAGRRVGPGLPDRSAFRSPTFKKTVSESAPAMKIVAPPSPSVRRSTRDPSRESDKASDANCLFV